METLKTVAKVQAVYFFVTGLWPLINMRSFIALTGPKTDLWLVEMVGLLAAAIGAGFGYALVKNTVEKAILLLVILSSLAFFYTDVYFSLNRVISPVYLGDALLQVVFVVSNGVWFLQKRK